MLRKKTAEIRQLLEATSGWEVFAKRRDVIPAISCFFISVLHQTAINKSASVNPPGCSLVLFYTKPQSCCIDRLTISILGE